jgi:hypothetical protein
MRFRHYKYMLMHHLDALVLSNGIERFCDSDLDLIGAPWLPCDDSPWVQHARVGNAGFALMKVESHLNVLRSTRRAVDPDQYWELLRAATPLSRRWLQPRVLIRSRSTSVFRAQQTTAAIRLSRMGPLRSVFWEPHLLW